MHSQSLKKDIRSGREIVSLRAKLQQKQRQIKEQNNRNEHYRKNDRGAR